MSDIAPRSWPDLATELFDLLTGRHAEICYHLDNMEVHVPSHMTPSGTAADSFAVWKFNGALRISSRILGEK